MTSVLPKFEVEWHEECPVGDDILGGLDRYLNEGIMPGGFLTACLENNLKEAFARADADNSSNMRNIVAYLYNYVPSAAWGSVDRVMEWQNKIHAAKRGSVVKYYEQDGDDFYLFESQEAYDDPACASEPSMVCTYPNKGFYGTEDMSRGIAAEEWFLEVWCPENNFTPIKLKQ